MLFIQSFKTLFVVIALWLIVAEARPKASPQAPELQEIYVEELPTFDEDPPIDADSFPLAPDVLNPSNQQTLQIGRFNDYHIRK